MKGATKRPPGSGDARPLSSPLDLSSAAGGNMFASSPSAKKSRLSPKHESSSQNESGSSSASCGDPGDVSPSIDIKPHVTAESIKMENDSRNGRVTPTSKCEKSQRLSVGRARSEATSPASFGRKSPASSGRKSPASSGRKSPASRDCGGCCRDGRRDCGQNSDPEVATWNVDDVCKFVESIDICAEYSPVSEIYIIFINISRMSSFDFVREIVRITHKIYTLTNNIVSHGKQSYFTYVI